MNNQYFILLLTFLLATFSFSADRYWVSIGPGNWNDTNNWSNAPGGTPGASAPGTGDNVFFNNSGAGDCTLDVDVDIDGINIQSNYTGTIDLNGRAFSPANNGTSNCIFTGGSIINSGAPVAISYITTGETVFSACTFGSTTNPVNLNITSGSVRFDGAVFNGTVSATQTGALPANGIGGSTFNGQTTLINSGSASLSLGLNNPDIFNEKLILINTGTANVIIAKSSVGTQFNENVEVASTNGLGIYLGSGTGSSVLANDKEIIIGPLGFDTGELRLNNFAQIGPSPLNITLGGTAILRFNYGTNIEAVLNVNAFGITAEQSTFQEEVSFHKTGSLPDDSRGNVFNEDVVLTNSGSGVMIFGKAFHDEFLKDLTINNQGTGSVEIAHGTTGNKIDGNLVLNGINASKDISLSVEVGSTLDIGGNVNIISASSALKSNVYIGNEGHVYINGNLDFVQNATGDSSNLRIAETTPSLVTIGGVATLINNGGGGSRRIYLGYSGDVIFNNDLIIENNATATYNGVYLNHFPGSTNEYNGNVVLTNTSSNGIYFGRGNGSPPGGFGELLATKTITIGPSGFTNGELYFRNFTQFGMTPQSVLPTGTTTLTIISCEWQGGGDFISPRITTRNSLYGRITHLEKTGDLDDLSLGANEFLMDATIRNTGTGAFNMGVSNSPSIHYDLWRADLNVISDKTGDITIAYESIGNEVNGNLNVTSNSTGNQNSYFSRFTNSSLEVGLKTTVLNDGTSGNVGIFLGLNGDIDFLGDLTISNSASSNIAEVVIANGETSQVLVDGASNISNLGMGGSIKRIVLGAKGDVTFNNTLNLDNSATSTVDSYILLNSDIESSNTYGGDILLNSTTNGASGDDGIFFGRRTSTTAGAGTLVSGNSISVGASNYIGDRLLFRNFTQLGTTPQSFVPLTGPTRFESRESVWNGPVTFISSRVFTNSSIYNSSAIFEKTGAIVDLSRGNNIFNGVTVIENSGNGNLAFANQYANDFNNDVTYIKTGSGLILPTYNAESTYAGSITVDASTIVVFGEQTSGRVTMDGITPQFISVVGSTPRPEFRALETQNSSDEITLNTPILIGKDLRLVQGNIISSSTNLITMEHNSNVTAVSDNAFVDGPISKIGKDPFVFPVGKQGYYRPISISGPNVINAQFNAEYFPQDIITSGTPDNPVAATIDHVSNCEYWILDKEVGISTIAVQVTLSYRDVPAFNCSGVVNPSELVVSRWDGSIWIDHGNDIASLTGNATNGTVTSFGPISNFSPFTIATTTANNPLPIELTLFEVEKQGTAAMVNWTTASELNNDYFNLERSSDGYNFESIAIVDGAGNSSTVIDYEYLDRDPKTGINYYRLKQTDFDGEFSYSDIKSVEFDAWDYLNIYPNPLISGKDLKISSTQIITQIDILNDLGQLVYTHTLSGKDMEFKIANLTLSPSVYFVKIHSNDYVEVKKLIVR